MKKKIWVRKRACKEVYTKTYTKNIVFGLGKAVGGSWSLRRHLGSPLYLSKYVVVTVQVVRCALIPKNYFYVHFGLIEPHETWYNCRILEMFPIFKKCVKNDMNVQFLVVYNTKGVGECCIPKTVGSSKLPHSIFFKIVWF